ncbi:MAG TPA: type II toxin-antitoxin system VapC family toxin [Bryobacteraceae bacterium]|nr:type II toxin-antitoxin system VapC family toxin [Bryobacteraceae bacterium]
MLRAAHLNGPFRTGETDVAAAIREALHSPEIELIPFVEEPAVRYAKIRGTLGVTPADAIHLGTAATAGIDLFLTNDHALQRLIVPGIHFIAGLDAKML